jgi:hypothetical protein
MPAIVTRNQSVINATKFIEDYVTENNYLYLGIAKADPWNDDLVGITDGTIPNANDSESMKSMFRDGMIGAKRILTSQFSKVIPRIDWSSGTTYDGWDDQHPAFFDPELARPKFYVLTSAVALYKCIRAGSGASTIEPSHTATEPQVYGDGYVWHYLYTVRSADALTFLNSQYIPILNSSSDSHILHEQNCKTSLDGSIFRIIITNGGSGYVTAPAVTIEGNGSGALATATISGGAVTGIQINTSGSNLVHGTGYDNARIVIAAPPGGGTQATARAVLSPKNGHGTDIENELFAYNVEIAVNLEYDETSTFITENDYRQIALIRNPVEFGDPEETFALAPTYNALTSMTVTSVAGGNFSSDDVIRQTTGTNTTARAYIDQVDTDSPYTIWYHQNYKTGWIPFEIGQTITNGNGSGAISGVVATKTDPGIDTRSGEIIFLENRGKITRSSTSREELRIIIEF